MTDPVEDVGYGTRAYLQELRELRAGQARHSGPATVTISAKRGAYHALIYSAGADDGDRTVVVVPLEGDPVLDSTPEGVTATFYGTLQPGGAVALSIDDVLYFPLGPAFKPGPLVPRFRASGPPPNLSTLFGYLGDSRYWQTRSVLPAAAFVAGVYAIGEQSLLALLVCLVAVGWFVVLFRRWRSTADPLDDGSGPVQFL